MTEEEWENLKPGDRVIFFPETVAKGQPEFIRKATKFQEECGGFLTVEDIETGRLYAEGFKDGWFFCYNIEKVNRPWSYKLDY
jgi:hypothetical protein